MTRRRKVTRSRGKQRRLERRARIRELREAELPRVVCETCGLEQPYLTSSDLWSVEPCANPSCAGETCITIEHYLELEQPVS